MSHKNLSAKIKIPKILKDKLNNKKINQIYKKFENSLNLNESFAVAVSGGPDSLALAFLSKVYSIKKNITSKFIEGLRVTDKDTVKVVEDVLANEINADIVKSISESGGKAIGLSGNKNTLLSATKLKLEVKNSDSNIEKIVDIGFVGQPTKVNINLINKHIKEGEIPVIAPLGIDNDGNSYNINADTAAGFIAGELKANKLLLLTDVAGILDQNKKLISSLTLDDASKIIDEDFIVGGMKPKILTCVEAMKKGVNKTTILDGRIPHSVVLELFTEHGIGTQIYS